MVFIFDHPLIKDKITRMRKKETESSKFRSNLKEITQLMIYEMTRSFEIKKIPIQTPLCETTGYKLKDKIVLVPILRAGLGMVDGVKELMPTASIGHIGLFRNESNLEINQYYCKLPNSTTNGEVIILDPMLATGSSALVAIDMIKKLKPKRISFLALVAAPEGINKIKENASDVNLYIGALDERLDKNSYIIPGLGDAGDRIFGTK